MVRVLPVVVPLDPSPKLESINPNICSTSGVLGQNTTLFVRIPPRFQTRAYTTTKVFNGGTVNGNYAVSIWASYDNGVNLTRLGGTASTAQSGTSSVQSAALSATVTVPAGVPLWLSISSDSATATHLRQSGFTGTRVTDDMVRSLGSYNATADFAASTFSAATLQPWIEIS